MKTKYEEELRKERENNVRYFLMFVMLNLIIFVNILSRLRGELGILKKKHLASQKELEDQKDNITLLSQDLQKLENKIQNLEKDKTELKKEIKSRDETIQNKEKDITELKGSVRNMEKYKYVLNHKIGLLEEEISPKVSKFNLYLNKLKIVVTTH